MEEIRKFKKYDFRTLNKYNNDTINLTIADTDFATPKFITNHLIEAISRGDFAYYLGEHVLVPHTLWYLENFKKVSGLTKDNLAFDKGVVSILQSAIRQHTKEGDYILIQNPVYSPFMKIIENSKRKIIDLDSDDQGINLNDAALKIKKYNVKLVLFCHPHNPSGYVFSREELAGLYQIVKESNAYLYCDEVWSDLVFEQVFHPFATIDQKSDSHIVSIQGLGKAFLLQALKFGYAYSYNQSLIAELKKTMETTEVAIHKDPLTLAAVEAVYSKQGLEWIAEYKKLIQENYTYLAKILAPTLIKVPSLKAMHVIWLDFSQVNLTHDQIKEAFKKANIILSDGLHFGSNGYKKFRLNIATTQDNLKTLLERLLMIEGLQKWINHE